MLNCKTKVEGGDDPNIINGSQLTNESGVYTNLEYPKRYRFVIVAGLSFMVNIEQNAIMKITEGWYNSNHKYVKTGEKLTLILQNVE